MAYDELDDTGGDKHHPGAHERDERKDDHYETPEKPKLDTENQERESADGPLGYTDDDGYHDRGSRYQKKAARNQFLVIGTDWYKVFDAFHEGFAVPEEVEEREKHQENV